MKIKEAAIITGISENNLRYYEKIGLIPKIQKDVSGVRDYSEEDIRWIKFILKFKETGAKLEYIKEYMHLAYSNEDTKEKRRSILLNVENELETQIEHLQDCLNIVRYKIKNYDDLCNPETEKIISTIKDN